MEQSILLDTLNNVESRINALLLKAEKSYKEGNNQKAIEIYSQALNVNSKNADIYYYRGFSYSEIGKYSEALNDYLAALRFHYSRKDKVYQQIGFCFIELKRYNDAVNAFNIAIKLDSLNRVLFANRAFSKLNLVNPDTCSVCRDYIKAIKLGDQDNINWVKNNCQKCVPLLTL